MFDYFSMFLWISTLIGIITMLIWLRNLFSVLFLMFISDDITRRALWEILKIYYSQFVSLKEIVKYSKEEKFIRAKMHARGYRYTRKKVNCVVGGQYDLALSQLAYVFVFLLVKDGVSVHLKLEQLKELMEEYLLVFRRKVIEYIKRHPADKDFMIELTLKKESVKHIEDLNADLPFAFLTIGGEVIQGEIINVALVNELKPS